MKKGDKLYDKSGRELIISKVLFSGVIATTKEGREVGIHFSALNDYKKSPTKKVVPVKKLVRKRSRKKPSDSPTCCKIEGCMGKPKKGETTYVRGYCWNHYKQHLKGYTDIQGNSLKIKFTKCKVTSDDGSECDGEPGSNGSYVKGFCCRHYGQYYRKEIDINGKAIKAPIRTPSVKIVPNEIALFIKYCQASRFEGTSVPEHFSTFINEWDKKEIEEKIKYLKCIKSSDIVKNIRSASNKDKTKVICTLRINEIEGIRCKIEGCTGKPSPTGYFSFGFCHRHHNHFSLGNITESGEPTKCKVSDCNKSTVKAGFCPAHYMHYKGGVLDSEGNRIGTPIIKTKARFNNIVLSLYRLKKDAEELQSLGDNNLSSALSIINEQLKFLTSPEFIQENMVNFSNILIKSILKKDDVMDVLNNSPYTLRSLKEPDHVEHAPVIDVPVTEAQVIPPSFQELP